MRAILVGLSAAIFAVLGAGFGAYAAWGKDLGFMFATTVVGALFGVFIVLYFATRYTDVGVGSIGARLVIWVPLVAGIGFFVSWTEGLGTQVIASIVGALFGLIMPSAIRYRRSRGYRTTGDSDGDWDSDGGWGGDGDGGGNGGGNGGGGD